MQKSSDTWSRVYFIHAPRVELIKIGVTGDLRHRLSSLRVSSPVPLVLLAHMPGERDDELKIQRRLYVHRRHGEWFADTPAVRECIAEALGYPQAIPLGPVERTPRAKRAVAEVMRLTYLSEEAALQLLRTRGDILLAIGRGHMRVAGKLISDAYAELDREHRTASNSA